MSYKTSFTDILRSITSFLQTRPGIFVAGAIVGACFVYVNLRVDNKRVVRDMEKREAAVTQKIDAITEIEGLSQNELKTWVNELHEQNRVTREIQNRLHKQEVALARSPAYLIVIVLALVALVAWIIRQIHKDMNTIAVNTLRNAVNLTPPNMIKTFLSAQNQANTLVTTKEVPATEAKLENKRRHRKRLR